MPIGVRCHQCGSQMQERPTPDGQVFDACLTLRDGAKVWREMDISGLPEWHCEVCDLRVTDSSRDKGYVYRFGVLFRDLIPLAMGRDRSTA